MTTTDMGRLGEIKVMNALVEQGWYPFTDISGKCPVDIIAWKDNVTITIQVKYCGYSPVDGSFSVQIGSIRPNRTENVIKKFDNEAVDYLAVYLEPLNTVCFIPASEISTGRSLTIREQPNGKCKFIVAERLNI